MTKEESPLTREAAARLPNHQLLNQRTWWHSNEGLVKIAKMDLAHKLNLLAYLHREAPRFAADTHELGYAIHNRQVAERWMAARPLFQQLLKQLLKELRRLDLARAANKQRRRAERERTQAQLLTLAKATTRYHGFALGLAIRQGSAHADGPHFAGLQLAETILWKNANPAAYTAQNVNAANTCSGAKPSPALKKSSAASRPGERGTVLAGYPQTTCAECGQSIYFGQYVFTSGRAEGTQRWRHLANGYTTIDSPQCSGSRPE